MIGNNHSWQPHPTEPGFWRCRACLTFRRKHKSQFRFAASSFSRLLWHPFHLPCGVIRVTRRLVTEVPA